MLIDITAEAIFEYGSFLLTATAHGILSLPRSFAAPGAP